MSTQAPLTRAKYPRTILAGPYGHPMHPILITVPIGTWTASIVFDIIGFFAEDASAFTVGAQVLILIGLIGAVLAAAVGLMDYTVIARGTAARRTALVHMVLNLIVTAVFLVSLIVRWGADHDRVSVAGFILSIVGLALLGVSGYLGGKLAYHYGVRVALESTQAEGFLRPAEVAQEPPR